jgi:predicted alpha-1,6-mannanase (GH76 family)
LSLALAGAYLGCANGESPALDPSGNGGAGGNDQAGRPTAGSENNGGSAAGTALVSGGAATGGSAIGGTATGGAAGATPVGSAGAPLGAVTEFDAQGLRARAQAAMVPLAAFYNLDTGLWDQNEWWTSANQLQTLVDYSRETGDPQYVAQIDTTFTKNRANDFGDSGYYNDDAWWAIAWLKAFDLTHQQKYLSMAKTIFTRMTGGWDDECGGGIYWASAGAGADGPNFKNAISNALFLQLASMLHLRTPGDSGPGSYLDWAQRQWSWFEASGLLTANNQVVDGLSDLTECKAEGAVYTYNQGALVGALVDYAAAADDPKLLDEAAAVAQATMTQMVTADGVLKEGSCAAEACVQFKGIFMRSLAQLNRARPSTTLRSYILRQGDALWLNGRNESDQLGYEWDQPFDKASAARQSSGVDALVSAIRAANMNLALGATASGPTPCTAASPAKYAVDGYSRGGSKWCAGGAGDQAFNVDLGALQKIIGFRIRHAGAGGEDPTWNTRDFELATSVDGATWTPAASVTDNTADITTHPIAAILARHVRLHITKAQTDPEFLATRIYELEILGDSY